MTGCDVGSYVRSFSSQLVEQSSGLWVTETEEKISYPDGAHDEYADVEATSYWFAHRNSCICSVVRHHHPGGPILDLGGGNGAVSAALAAAGFKTIVLEPGFKGAEVARSRGLPVIRASFQSAGIADESLHAVGMFDVLEHIEQDLSMLRDVRRTLRPSGWIYLTLPAYQWLWSDEDRAVGHFRRYTATSARDLLGAAGFSVSFATYMFAPLVLPIFLLRSLPSMVGRHDHRQGKVADDHKLPDNPIGTCIRRILTWEARRIEHNKSIPFGSSVLIAARKA